MFLCSLKSGCLDVRRLLEAGFTKIGLGTGEAADCDYVCLGTLVTKQCGPG